RCKYDPGSSCSFSLIRTFCFRASPRRYCCSRSDPSHQNIFCGFARSSTWWTQSRTAWFTGLWSPIPWGGEMAGARFFMGEVNSETGKGTNFFRFLPFSKKFLLARSPHFFGAREERGLPSCAHEVLVV